MKNWAGNLTYGAARVIAPTTLDEVREAVRTSDKLRPLGSRHSFNEISNTSGSLISLAKLSRVIEIDARHATVTIDGGVTYGELGETLHAAGYALHNLASLPHISVAGACATATHGSGETNCNLATAVVAMELVSADGEVHSLSPEARGDDFNGMVVSLGALGVITKLTLRIEPTFDITQRVYESLSMNEVTTHLNAIESAAYSVSMFTDWLDNRFTQVWLKEKSAAGSSTLPASFHGASPALQNRHPIAGIDAEPCTPQMGEAGPWHHRLPHFRMDFTPSSGEELQSEYYVPRHDAVHALETVMAMGRQIAPHLLVSEVRAIAADELWLSPCCKQACIALHFTWKPDWNAVRPVLGQIESALAPFEARPHWGKLFTQSPDHVGLLFPRLHDFQRLAASFDPAGKFRNGFLDEYVLGESG